MQLRRFEPGDADALWAILHEVVAAGDTYAIPPDIGRAEALALWTERTQECWVALIDGMIVGTYYVKPNQAGPGDHVANAGYMVASAARGQGVARAMCLHSLARAQELGYRGMQFNLVVETNVGAVRLWQSLGFAIVGTVPEAFRHPTHGLVGTHVMYRSLK